MGCLKGIFRFIIFSMVIFAFIFFGGCDFVKEKYVEYTNPPRQVLIREEMDFGNMIYVPQTYSLQRSISLGKYRKISARHKSSGQKISIIDMGDTKLLSQNDFYSKQIDKKLEELIATFKDSIFPVDDFKITQRSTVLAKGKIIPYVEFRANVRFVPFLTINGTIAGYSTVNENETPITVIGDIITNNKDKTSTKIIISTAVLKKYSPDITKDFISKLCFQGL